MNHALKQVNRASQPATRDRLQVVDNAYTMLVDGLRSWREPDVGDAQLEQILYLRLEVDPPAWVVIV